MYHVIHVPVLIYHLHRILFEILLVLNIPKQTKQASSKNIEIKENIKMISTK